MIHLIYISYHIYMRLQLYYKWYIGSLSSGIMCTLLIIFRWDRLRLRTMVDKCRLVGLAKMSDWPATIIGRFRCKKQVNGACMITSHNIVRDVITYPCLIWLSMSSFRAFNAVGIAKHTQRVKNISQYCSLTDPGNNHVLRLWLVPNNCLGRFAR